MSAASGRRRLTFCADDFGQTEQINLAVIELILAGRLGATSVMSQGPAWPQGARQLKQCEPLADIGLHLNLTHRFEGQAAARPLPYWMLAAPLGLINARVAGSAVTLRGVAALFVLAHPRDARRPELTRRATSPKRPTATA